MAQTLAGGIARAHPEMKFIVHDPAEQALTTFRSKVESANSSETRVEFAASNEAVFLQSRTVFLAVKPQFFSSVLAEPVVESPLSVLIVSVMAGVSMQRIGAITGCERMIRVMPNTPCLIGEGISAMAASVAVSTEDQARIRSYLESVGTVEVVEESLLDAVTGLSGSGPAYVYAFIDALTRGGVEAGLPNDVASRLAKQTVWGAASMVKKTGLEPGALRDMVTSPGGTTLAGLQELAERGFHEAVVSAIERATRRAEELGKME